MKKSTLVLSVLIFNFQLSIFNCSAQAPSWIWAKNVAGGNNVYSTNSTTDANGNSYVTGGFSGGSVTIGSFTLANAGGQDMWVAKYDPNGNVVWAKSAGGSGGESGSGIAVDSLGNVYVEGGFQSSSITFGSTTLTNNGATNVYLVKYDANGNVMWAKGFGGSSNDNPLNSCVATDFNGNVFISGVFRSSSIAFGSYTLNSTGGNNPFIAKLDGAGNALWAKTANGGCAGVYTIATDKKGNAYIAGNLFGSTITFGSHTLNLIGTMDAFTVKYDSSGNVRWAKNFGGNGGPNMVAVGITADITGGVYITGYFSSPTVTFGSTILTNENLGGNNFAYFIAKYDSGGNEKWAESAGGREEIGDAIAMDANNNVYVDGKFAADSIKLGSYTLHISHVGNYNDCFIVKYDTAGKALWAYGAGRTNTQGDNAVGIAINNGNIYVAGYFSSDSITLGNTALTNATPGSYNTFLAKLSTCGLNITTSTISSTCGIATGSATATVSNGTAPFSYFWTNGSSAAKADSLASGLYIVKVKDKNGCTTTATAKVLDASAPGITLDTVNNVTCPGENNGSITISIAGGALPYTFYWDNGSTAQNISNLIAGPYQVEVTDANGCKATQVISISQPPAFSLSICTTTASCSGSNGSATLTASGGTGSYSYMWKPSGQTVYNAASLAAGSYSVVVTDASGCKDSISAAVENTGGPIVTVRNITHADCFTGTLGTITISDTGGTVPYTYLWSNGATTSSITAPAGFYNVTVTDASPGGCKGVTSAQIQDTLPQGVSLCEVTVDTNQQNQVLWNRSAEHKIASYNIYRETTSAGIYRLAATLPYDSLTLWTDPIAIPQSRGYRYKVSEVDSCGDESPLSPYNLTLHLSVNDVLPAGSYKLIWDTSYNGLIFTHYYIYRDTIINSFTLIDSVLKGIQTYTDHYSTTKNIYYRVGINNPNGCNPTRSHAKTYNTSHSNAVMVQNGIITSTAKINKEAASVTVYPNPGNGLFTFQLGIMNQKSGIEIYNELGQKVYQQSSISNSQFVIDLKPLPAGIYLYRIISEDGKYAFNGKLIKD